MHGLFFLEDAKQKGHTFTVPLAHLHHTLVLDCLLPISIKNMPVVLDPYIHTYKHFTHSPRTAHLPIP
jgi:hypothetical protein